MASDRQGWLADLSRQFKRHRQGRPGWFLRVKRYRLLLLSDELSPPRPPLRWPLAAVLSITWACTPPQAAAI